MPTLPSHGLAAVAILAGVERRRLRPDLALAGAICAMLPDVDVIGLRLGVHYGSMLGHRGLTHSIFFAAAVATIISIVATFEDVGRLRAWVYLFLCVCSHGVLDAATNGGLGVAFLSPFSNTRYFWPVRPIEVSPIGLGHAWVGRGAAVLFSELRWVWMPSLAIILSAFARSRSPRPRGDRVVTS